MPWCEPCERYLTPNAVRSDGSCPTCGGDVDAAPGIDHEPRRAPWHFWLMVVAAVLYLVWRAVDFAVGLF